MTANLYFETFWLCRKSTRNTASFKHWPCKFRKAFYKDRSQTITHKKEIWRDIKNLKISNGFVYLKKSYINFWKKIDIGKYYKTYKHNTEWENIEKIFFYLVFLFSNKDLLVVTHKKCSSWHNFDVIEQNTADVHIMQICLH